MPFCWLKPLSCNSSASDDILLPSPSFPRRHSSHSLLQILFLPPPHKTPLPLPLPTLYELPSEHSSRRIIELIFRSSWLPSPSPARIELLFRVCPAPLAVAAFEARRTAASARSSGDGRCAADGNEMMRFHAPVAGGGVERCRVGGMEGVRTFAGSGVAHERGAGGGSGRRGVMVCRVIAGRIGDPEDIGSGSGVQVDSVRVGEGEMLVLDARAVLPCFLIIYKV